MGLTVLRDLPNLRAILLAALLVSGPTGLFLFGPAKRAGEQALCLVSVYYESWNMRSELNDPVPVDVVPATPPTTCPMITKYRFLVLPIEDVDAW